jgi:hypothetical protein
VVPRSQGGGHSWENVVGACRLCNRRKGGRTPEQAGMKLLSEPKAPRGYGYHVPHQYFSSHIEWRKYLPYREDISPGLQIAAPRPGVALWSSSQTAR